MLETETQLKLPQAGRGIVHPQELKVGVPTWGALGRELASASSGAERCLSGGSTCRLRSCRKEPDLSVEAPARALELTLIGSGA